MRRYSNFVVRGLHLPDIPDVKLDLPHSKAVLPIATVKARALKAWRAEWGIGDVTSETIDSFAREFPTRWRGDHLNRYEYLSLWAYEFMAILHREQLEAVANPAAPLCGADAEKAAALSPKRRVIALTPDRLKRNRTKPGK